MSDMLDFCSGMLLSISDFLASPPLIYLFGFFAMALALKWLKSLIDF